MSLKNLAQIYNEPETQNVTTQADSGSPVVAIAFALLTLLLVAVLIVGTWKMYKKAGKPGWASIVPIYNYYVLLKIAGRPGWWLILLLIPFINFIVSIIIGIDIAKRFGYSDIFGAIVCGILGIGFAIIGFGTATYKGDGLAQPNNSAPPSQPAQT